MLTKLIHSIKVLIKKLQDNAVFKKLKDNAVLKKYYKKIIWLMPHINRSYNQTIVKYWRYIKKSKGYKHRLTAYYHKYKKHPNKSAFMETTLMLIITRLRYWWWKTRKNREIFIYKSLMKWLKRVIKIIIAYIIYLIWKKKDKE